MREWSVLVLCVLLCAVYQVDGFTFRLKPFNARCLYEDIPPNTNVRVEYTLHGGGVGRDMPVNFWVRPKDNKDRKYHHYHGEKDHGVSSFTTPDIADGLPIRYEFCVFHQYLGRDDDIKESFRKVTINIDLGADIENDDTLGLAKKDYMDSVHDSINFVISRMDEVREQIESAKARSQTLDEETMRLSRQVMVMNALACIMLIAGGAFETFYVGNFLKKRKLV
mmetsp:Transcript_6793/g.12144  ORF Transcript_6793/g.12144 Transcript_6793/m.12144 type:complete len:223 (-) Transcript_6793:1264-1932(-)